MARIRIGRTVRRLRTERNLSQQALANRLGISASYLNLIEHDQRTVSGTLLIKLAEIFHLDLATLSGPRSIGWRSGFEKRSPILCWASTPYRTWKSPPWPAQVRMRRAPCSVSIALGGLRAKMPEV